MLSPTASPIEKIHAVLESISHQLALTPTGNPVAVSPFSIMPLYYILETEFKNILLKLEQDEHVIQILTYPKQKYMEKIENGVQVKQSFDAFRVTPTEKFAGYCQTIKAQVEELRKAKASTHSFQPLPIAPQPNQLSPNQTELNSVPISLAGKGLIAIRFDDLNRHIILNDCFLIAQPAYDSENYRFFSYVWNNPNRLITLEEFNKNLEEPLKKPFTKILENLNFKGALKDAFFQVSKTSVCFTPSRSYEALISAGCFPLRLFSAKVQ